MTRMLNDMEEQENIPSGALRVIGYVPPDSEVLVRIDKATHRLVVRKEDETESDVWVRIEPRRDEE